MYIETLQKDLGSFAELAYEAALTICLPPKMTFEQRQKALLDGTDVKLLIFGQAHLLLRAGF
jgi:hypothetical protein